MSSIFILVLVLTGKVFNLTINECKTKMDCKIDQMCKLSIDGATQRIARICADKMPINAFCIFDEDCKSGYCSWTDWFKCKEGTIS